MIKIKNTKLYGLEESLIASGYPMSGGEPPDIDDVRIGEKDRERAIRLAKAKQGSGHDCFLKGIIVQFDLRFSLYFTKQLQRYHFIDFVSSQSTMHTLTKNSNIIDNTNKYVDMDIIEKINNYIMWYNKFDDIKDDNGVIVINGNVYDKYTLFMKIVSNLPSGFEYWARMTTNYLQLKTIHHQRKHHKLEEDWGRFCAWIKQLPMFKELILDD